MQVPSTPKLSVTNLKGNGHFVVLVKHLVEAFSSIGCQVYIVRDG
jgi:hypothetical protein